MTEYTVNKAFQYIAKGIPMRPIGHTTIDYVVYKYGFIMAQYKDGIFDKCDWNSEYGGIDSWVKVYEHI